MITKYGDDVDYCKYNLKTKEKVCSHHINDCFIKQHITQNGKFEICSYCGKKVKVIDLKNLLQLIITKIDYLFEDPADSRYLNKDNKYGFDGDVFTFYELWYDNLLDLHIDNDKLSDDIYNYLENSDLYCYKDEFVSEVEILNSIWGNFKNTVKHKARYVFYYKRIFSDYTFIEPFEILKKVQNFILELNLFSVLPIETKLYRCRQHRELEDVTEKKDLSSPPDEKTKTNGRMNPAGISMFYCSQNRKLTISEIVNFSDNEKPFYSVGYFKNKKEIRLVDLTKLPKLPSMFDAAKNNNIDNINFLKGFIKDISKPIGDNDSIIEYVPTQIVTEYIKFNPEINVDGIIYPSSKEIGKNNIVLFYNQEESLKKLDFQTSKIMNYKI